MQSLSTSLANGGSFSGSTVSGLPTSSHYRVRITSGGNSLIFAYSPFFTVHGLDPDAYEPDNRQALAKDIVTTGVAQAHTISINDTDWVQFNATAGKSYLVTVNGSVSVYAYVLDSSGTQISYNYGAKFSQAFTPTQSGKYFVRAQYYSGYGAYALTVTEFDASKGSAAAKILSPSDTSAWMAGNAYYMSWTPDTAVFGYSVSLSLYLDSTLLQTFVSGTANNGTYLVNIPAGSASSGRYRMRIANYSDSRIFGYGPYFNVVGISPDAFEPDNGKVTAKDISTDGLVQAHTLSINDSDWVSFNAVAGKNYLMNVNGALSMYAYLLDSNGTQISYNYGTKFSLSFAPARSGKYFLRMQNYSGYGNYTVSAQEFDPAVGSASPKFQAPDTSTTWASGAAYALAWTPDTATFGPTVSLALYFDTTLIQSIVSGTSNLGSSALSLASGLASSNHYRIRLTAGSNSMIYGYSPYFSIAGIAPDSLEPNDSARAASPVVLNSPALPLTLSSRDHDWFKFTGKAQQLYVIQAASNGTLATTLRLYSGIGSVTLQTNYKTGVADTLNTINWICPSDGQYTVSVEPYSTSYSGAYGFQIQEVDPSQYKFGVTSPAAAAVAHVGAVLPIAWTDPSALKGQVDIFLYDAKGVVQTVYSSAPNTGAYNWTVPTGLPSGSAYYLKVISRISASISGTSAVFSIAP